MAAIERSVPGTGGQAQPAPFTSAGSASIEIDNFVQLCGRKVLLPENCLKRLSFAEQYVENEELLAASQRWLGNATDDEKASDEGTNCQLDIENRLNIQRTYKQEGYDAYQEVWFNRIEPFQRAMERFADDIVTPADYEGYAQACRCVLDLVSSAQPLLVGTPWEGSGNEEWIRYFEAWEKIHYDHLMEHRCQKAEEERQEQMKWDAEHKEEERKAEEAKAKRKAKPTSAAGSQSTQGEFPPAPAATSQATGVQGALPPASSSGAEPSTHESPRTKQRTKPDVPAFVSPPDYDPPSDAERRRWEEEDKRRKTYDQQRAQAAVRIQQVLEEMKRQHLEETEQPPHRWQDTQYKEVTYLILPDEAWPLDTNDGFWINYTK